jgi:hypothetical protein
MTNANYPSETQEEVDAALAELKEKREKKKAALPNRPPVPGFNLVGADGNASSILGRFSRQARRAGWPKEDIEAVLTEARSGDYSHLLQTMIPYDSCDHEDDD